MYMLGSYLFNKIAVFLNNGLERPLNWAKALMTMSPSMVVNTSVTEATRLAVML